MSVSTTQPYSVRPGRHIGQIFFQRVAELGDRLCIKVQKEERFEAVSWRAFGDLVQNLLLALYALRLPLGEPVAIIGENSLPWLCADLATLAGGFPNVVVSPALSDSMLLKVLGHSRCRAAFVENEAAVGRLLNLQGQLPELSWIFVMQNAAVNAPGTQSFAQLVERGRAVDPGRLGRILESVHPGDLATIMYTSGSTGEPKGVMRTQDNLLSNITNGGPIPSSKPDELIVIVLSLNHLFGRFGFLKSAVAGRATAIIEATEMDLDFDIVASLPATAMAVVPRVMERIFGGVLDRGQNRQLWERFERLDRDCTAGTAGDAACRERDEVRSALKASVRQILGGRLKYISYGGAAMPPRIMRFFEAIGIPLIGSYGLTECGGVTLCSTGDNRPGSLGRPFSNVELRIADDGEIFVRGPTVTPGYFQNPEATREALDDEGWFHTGDLGVLDDGGSLRIIGRKKDVFYCADGSNIYPGFIEMLLENEVFIRQAVLLGDQRSFIAALVVPDRHAIAAWRGQAEASLSGREIDAAVGVSIDRVNARLEHYEQVRRFAVVEEDFPAEVRSVNVFKKIRIDRRAVAERYARVIETIYMSASRGELN